MPGPKPALQHRKRRYRFLLTPLADVMFLLLVFFMLSSSLTPYSLLTLRGGAAPDRQAGAGGSGPEAPILAGDTALWAVSPGEVTTGGQSFGFEALPQLAAALTANETRRVVVISRNAAQVQDVARVLEALSGVGIDEVQIARAPGR